jgi:hypothetical protein
MQTIEFENYLDKYPIEPINYISIFNVKDQNLRKLLLESKEDYVFSGKAGMRAMKNDFPSHLDPDALLYQVIR